jgi:thioredoxin 1
MSTTMIDDTTDATFETDVLQSTQPVLVDCWATWCGPCKAIAPLLDEAAQTYEGRLKIVKINVDENRTVPAMLGVRGVPTLLLFDKGQLKTMKVGAVTKAQLGALIDGQLAAI